MFHILILPLVLFVSLVSSTVFAVAPLEEDMPFLLNRTPQQASSLNQNSQTSTPSLGLMYSLAQDTPKPTIANDNQETGAPAQLCICGSPVIVARAVALSKPKNK